jgi:lysosomal Pro-X carboxypeptidase
MSYPNIVAGGLAASAPVVQFVGEYPNYDLFNEIVTDDYTQSSASCSAAIRSGFNILNTAKPHLYSQISSAFKLCTPIKHEYDVQNLIAYVENAITYMAMTDYPDATNFLQPLPAWPVDAACAAISKVSFNNALAQLAAASNVYYNTSGTLTCNDLNAPSSPGLGDQSWNYQACTELVLPSSQTGVRDFFPPAPFIESQYTANCQQTLSVTPRYRWIPLQYGGFNITAHSNIIFSNGNLDPWSGGGIKTTLKPSLPAIIIDKGAHHLDLRFSSPADPESVVNARKLEASYLLTWIREWYAEQGIASPL